MRWNRIACHVAALSFILGSGARAENDTFNGAWTVEFTPTSAAVTEGAKDFKDAALFHNNELSSEAFGMYGFNTVTYTLQEDNPNIFTATMTSQTQGTLQWAGQKQGDRVVGILLWTKPSGQIHKYNFVGNVLQPAED